MGTNLLVNVANIDGNAGVTEVREAGGRAIIDPLDGLLLAGSPRGAGNGSNDLEVVKHVI